MLVRRILALAGTTALLFGLAIWPASATVTTLASDGHSTNPVWYHDTVGVQVGSILYMAWNTNAGSIEARAFNRSTGAFSGAATQVSSTLLDCGCTDSTGTNPNRHDVPSLFADPAGRVYALYGGGTAAHTGTGIGPFFRAASAVRSISGWGTEQRLTIPGSAYDFEIVRDNHGVNHIIGQQGDNPGGAGSLLYLRLTPGTSTTPGTLQPYHVLIQGGYDSTACAWRTTPGCNIYVIGRIAVGPKKANSAASAPLYVTWGYSEAGLSAGCGDPAGFCNHGLYLAASYDGGVTWYNATKTAAVKVSSGPIAYNDPRFQVVSPSVDVGLYKAVAVTGAYPGTPWIAYQPGADEAVGKIAVTHHAGSGWVTQTVDSTRSWNNHLAMLGTSTGHLYLWSDIAQTGNHASEVAQWVGGTTSSSWFKSYLTVGPNWFLTGTRVSGGELLMWRVPQSVTTTSVAFAALSAS
jgi:hypothetical protein